MTIFATIRALANIAHKHGNVQVQMKMGNSTYLPAAPIVCEKHGETFVELDVDQDYVNKTESCL